MHPSPGLSHLYGICRRKADFRLIFFIEMGGRGSLGMAWVRGSWATGKRRAISPLACTFPRETFPRGNGSTGTRPRSTRSNFSIFVEGLFTSILS